MSDWSYTWMQVAHVVAQRSKCDRAQVGAVMVTCLSSSLTLKHCLVSGVIGHCHSGLFPLISFCILANEAVASGSVAPAE